MSQKNDWGLGESCEGRLLPSERPSQGGQREKLNFCVSHFPNLRPVLQARGFPIL